MLRFEATQLILKYAGDRPVVANLGPTTDELWHAQHRDRNFYTYGNMGLCSSLALGMAVSTDEQVISCRYSIQAVQTREVSRTGYYGNIDRISV